MYKYLANPRKHKKNINRAEDQLFIYIKKEYGGNININDYNNIKSELDDIIVKYFCKSVIYDIINKIDQ